MKIIVLFVILSTSFYHRKQTTWFKKQRQKVITLKSCFLKHTKRYAPHVPTLLSGVNEMNPYGPLYKLIFCKHVIFACNFLTCHIPSLLKSCYCIHAIWAWNHAKIASGYPNHENDISQAQNRSRKRGHVNQALCWDLGWNILLFIFQIDVLEAELGGLKTLVLTSTPSSPNKHLHPQIDMPKEKKTSKPFWKTHRRSTSHHEFTRESRQEAEDQQYNNSRCTDVCIM